MKTYWYMFTYWLTWFYFYFCWLLLSIPDRSHPITNSLPVNMWGLHGSDVTILVVFSCHSSPNLWYPSIVHTEQYFRSLHGDVWLMLPRPRKTHGTKIKPHSNPDISPRSWRILDEDRVEDDECVKLGNALHSRQAQGAVRLSTMRIFCVQMRAFATFSATMRQPCGD